MRGKLYPCVLTLKPHFKHNATGISIGTRQSSITDNHLVKLEAEHIAHVLRTAWHGGVWPPLMHWC